MAVSSPDTDLQALVDTPFLVKAGHYSVTVGGKPVKFWPLDPDKLDQVTAVFEAEADVLPGTTTQADFSTLVLPPQFGIFDIAIEFSSKDDVDLATISPLQVWDQYCLLLMGKPVIDQMPLTVQWPESRICFAVPIKRGDDEFSGKLRLEAQIKGTQFKKHIELPIKVKKSERVDNLFVFFVAHKSSNSVEQLPKPNYCWCKLKVVEASDAAPPVADATAKLKLLRDNQAKQGYDKANRRVELESNSDGYACYNSYKRDVLGLPIDWPVIINVEKYGFVPRGHLLRLNGADVKDNLSPVNAPPGRINIRMTKLKDADLSDKKILLDPGHGVVYDNSNRRCQEWYVAHRVGDRIVQTLTNSPYNIPPANIFWTRTAGFGLIDPGNVHVPGAPEVGDHRYKFDLPGRKIRIANAALGLKNLSDLLLTNHGDKDVALAVDDADRTRLLAINVQTVNQIVARINASKHPHHQRVRPDSVRWDSPSESYVYTLERTNAKPNENPVVNDSQAFPISTADWFNVDDAIIRVLADRSARWSLQCEVGSGPVADAASGRLSFLEAARNALGVIARDYMRDRILQYLNVVAPHPYLDHGIKGWGPDARMTYINSQACDLYLTLHENATDQASSSDMGAEVLASRLGGANAPPDDEIRLGKIFMKYVDPFDRGVRSTGVTKEEPGDQPGTGSVGMLHNGNQRRAFYVYLESEFMTAIDPDDPSKYMYERMVGDQFIQTLADQIVAASVEYLLPDWQPNLDDIQFRNTFTLW
jgi:N-acetylmuramoyl-L-alanine amidase